MEEKGKTWKGQKESKPIVDCGGIEVEKLAPPKEDSRSKDSKK